MSGLVLEMAKSMAARSYSSFLGMTLRLSGRLQQHGPDVLGQSYCTVILVKKKGVGQVFQGKILERKGLGSMQLYGVTPLYNSGVAHLDGR